MFIVLHLSYDFRRQPPCDLQESMEGPTGDVELAGAARHQEEESSTPNKDKAGENKPVPEKDEELKAAEEGESKRAGADPMTIGSLRTMLQQQQQGRCCNNPHPHPAHGPMMAGAGPGNPMVGVPLVPGFNVNAARLANMSKEQVTELRRLMQARLAESGLPVPLDADGRPLVPDGDVEAQPVQMDAFEAIKLGLGTYVRKLMQDAVEAGKKEELVNSRDGDGHTLMHWAVKRGDLPMVQYLADMGAPLFERTLEASAMYPMHWAATEGHISIIHFLVTKGADINCRDSQNCTPLLIAAQYGKAGAVAYLIKSGADTSLLDCNQDSAMHWAAYKGDLSIVQLLNHLGLPLTVADGFGQTPLHLAALRGNLAVVEYMVADCDVPTDAKDNNGCTPLDLASKKGESRVSTFLKSREATSFQLKQCLSLKQWQQWVLGGGTAQASKWPFYVVIGSTLFCHIMFPVRFFNATGREALRGHEVFIYFNWAIEVLTWVFFLAAWLSDPGYVKSSDPENKKAYDEALSKLSSASIDALLQQGGDVNRVKMPSLCHACHVVRPIRSKHCRVCKQCVEVFDHHCPFIGNCVGVKNYKWFMAYVITLFTAQASWLATSILYMAKTRVDWLTTLGIIWVTPLTMMSCFLLIYHLQLMSNNLTTNEQRNFWRYDYFKDDDSGRMYNPFNRGCARNFASRLCGSPQSQLVRLPYPRNQRMAAAARCCNGGGQQQHNHSHANDNNV